MEIDEKELAKLQEDTIEKEKISLAIHSALFAFSSTGLLLAISMPNTVATCAFIISMAAFAIVVLSQMHTLHQTSDFHIGHVITSEDHRKHPRFIGVVFLLIGLGVTVSAVSYVCTFVFVVACAIVAKMQSKFTKELHSMVGLREFVKTNNVSPNK